MKSKIIVLFISACFYIVLGFFFYIFGIDYIFDCFSFVFENHQEDVISLLKVIAAFLLMGLSVFYFISHITRRYIYSVSILTIILFGAFCMNIFVFILICKIHAISLCGKTSVLGGYINVNNINLISCLAISTLLTVVFIYMIQCFIRGLFHVRD